MTFDGDVVDLEHESAATDRRESSEEIGQVISAFGLIVGSDGPSERLDATIADRFEAQGEAHHVEASWVERWRDGDTSDSLVAARVFNTRRFPESATD